MKRLWNAIISKIDTPVWLEIVFPILLLLRIPSFFEPYYYGDEMIYLTLGEGIRKGIPLYLGLHDNKPPLLYLTAALAGNLFWFKVILAFWSLITVYLFWKLVSSMFPKREPLHKVSTIIFGLLTTLPLFEGNTVNAELFMIGPVIFSFWIVLNKKHNFRNLFFSGLLVSIASLFKIPAAFDILAIVTYFLITTKFDKSGLKELFNKCLFLSLGFITPILLSLAWYFATGGFKEYLVAAFLQNFGYVSSWRPKTESISFLTKNGPLLIRAAIMFFGFFVLGILKNKVTKQFLILSLWLLASLFAVTLSERPYPHYFVQALPTVSIFLGMLLSNKTVGDIMSIIPLTLAFFVPFYYKFWYYPSFSYYTRFINFAVGRTSKEDYFNSFSPTVLSNYQISEFIGRSSSPNEKIFVWGNDASTIYALSKRLPPIKYVADYHIVDFSNKNEVLKSLSSDKPKFVVTQKNSFNFPELYDFLAKDYYIISEFGTSYLWLHIQK